MLNHFLQDRSTRFKLSEKMKTQRSTDNWCLFRNVQVGTRIKESDKILQNLLEFIMLGIIGILEKDAKNYPTIKRDTLKEWHLECVICIYMSFNCESTLFSKFMLFYKMFFTSRYYPPYEIWSTFYLETLPVYPGTLKDHPSFYWSKDTLFLANKL